jgi:hypothetical protein
MHSSELGNQNKGKFKKSLTFQFAIPSKVCVRLQKFIEIQVGHVNCCSELI